MGIPDPRLYVAYGRLYFKVTRSASTSLLNPLVSEGYPALKSQRADVAVPIALSVAIMVSLSTATTPRRPGIMLVGPRLKEPSDESAATFLRWTKLHFRDMLNMPDDPSLGKMT